MTDASTTKITNPSLEYARRCQGIIARKNLGYAEAAHFICSLSTPSHLHPLLQFVRDLAQDIDDGFRDKADNESAWHMVVRTIESFVKLEWPSTTWMLIAIYGEHENEKITHTYGCTIARRNGETTFESGSDALIALGQKINQSLNQDQTDEWYIRNFAESLPNRSGNLMLEDISVMDAYLEW